MRKLILVLSFCFALQLGYAQTEILTNSSVLDMIEMGFDDDVIISKINNTPTNFETEISTLKVLKEKGVSNEIIKAMVAVSKKTVKKEEVKLGVFMLKDTVELQLFPTVFSGSKSRTLASALTYGIASEKQKSTIHDVQSRNVIPSGKCTFIFYFKPPEKAFLHNADWWFRTATSPNEFALVVLDVNRRKNCREIEIGAKNVYAGESSGVRDSRVKRFVVEQLDKNKFKVTTDEPLPVGEYCFYYQGNIPEGGVYRNQSVFDFSVR